MNKFKPYSYKYKNMHEYIKRKKSNWLTKVYILKWRRKNIALYSSYFFLINGRLFLLISCIYIIILHFVLKIKHKAHWPRYSPEKHLIAKHKFEQKRLLKGHDYYLPLTSMAFHLNKCYLLHIWTLYAKFGWNWPGSSEKRF